MFGSLTFGGGYFGQGPPGVAVIAPPNPAQADVTVMVRPDVGTIQVRPDDGTVRPQSAEEVEPQ